MLGNNFYARITIVCTSNEKAKTIRKKRGGGAGVAGKGKF